jgi:phage tail sheath protein FI
MPEYLAPGTYTEELRSTVSPIEGVSTSTAGFVGRTERGPDTPLLVTSWLEYVRWFGVHLPASVSYLPFAVQGFFANGGQRLFVARVNGAGALRATVTRATAAAGQGLVVDAIGTGVWGNSVRVAFLPTRQTPKPAAPGRPAPPLRFRLVITYLPPGAITAVTEEYDDLAIDPAVPRYSLATVNSASHLVSLSWAKPTDPPSLPKTDAAPAPGQAPTTVPLTKGSDGAALKALDYEGDPNAPLDQQRGLLALSAIDQISMLAVPDLVGPIPATDQGHVREALLQQCESLRDRMAILDVAGGSGDVTKIQVSRTSDYAAIYYPFVRVLDPLSQQAVLVPPSGFIAGIYAFNDVTRGVHKAPANYEVRGILSDNLTPTEGPLEYTITKGQHDILNPEGINVLRDFRASGLGVRVWGARTISQDPGWTYVNVRRLFMFVEESIDEALQWVVFEPNAEYTWDRVRQSISVFLTRVWQDGALMGTTPEEAFFVRCDRSTMATDDILNGRLICLIGLAAVRPAEFVIFRYSQFTVEATR